MKLFRFVFSLAYKSILLVKNIRLFILPNSFQLIQKVVYISSFPSINQFLKISGKGKVFIGDHCSFGFKMGGFHRGGSIEFQPRYKDAVIKIGNTVGTNNNICIISANYIEIGDNSLIGQNVTIMDYEAHGINPDKRNEIGEIGSVIIGKNVWIGNNVIILKNSEIGENSIVAAGAVVCGKFPSNVIIGGVPAKVIKEI